MGKNRTSDVRFTFQRLHLRFRSHQKKLVNLYGRGFSMESCSYFWWTGGGRCGGGQSKTSLKKSKTSLRKFKTSRGQVSDEFMTCLRLSSRRKCLEMIR